MVGELVDRCRKALLTVTDDYEIILVNDCSPDASWDAIRRECARDPRVVGVDLSRNFGQHPAISMGLSMASGDWVVVMDCDLQDRPEEIPALYAKALEGWDIVQARRILRQDSSFKKLTGRIFHAVYDWLSGEKTDPTIANFGIYRADVVRAVVRIPDLSRGFGPLLNHLGFRTTAINVRHSARAEGTTSYTLRKLLKFAVDNCVANSNKPLRMAVTVGLTMSVLSFMLALWNLLAKLFGLIKVEGFTTTVFSIWFVGGLTLLVLGIIGIYIGRIYDQVKGRPYAVIRETINKENDSRCRVTGDTAARVTVN